MLEDKSTPKGGPLPQREARAEGKPLQRTSLRGEKRRSHGLRIARDPAVVNCLPAKFLFFSAHFLLVLFYSPVDPGGAVDARRTSCGRTIMARTGLPSPSGVPFAPSRREETACCIWVISILAAVAPISRRG